MAGNSNPCIAARHAMMAQECADPEHNKCERCGGCYDCPDPVKAGDGGLSEKVARWRPE